MMPAIGRLFQIAGLIILPVGLSIGMFGGNIALEVRLLFIGGACFLAGWLMAKKTS